MTRLKHKTCIVTGAARGIGAAIAMHFVREGANVIVTDLDIQNGERQAHRLGCRFIRLDIREEQDWEKLEQEVPEPDILVNNAGITGFEGGQVDHDPEHASLEDWRAVHRTNLDGTFLGCRYALRRMGRTGEESIINISSCSGRRYTPATLRYCG